MPATGLRLFWKYSRGLAVPVLIVLALVAGLAYSLYSRVYFWQEADEYNMREWLNEARTFRKTLPDLVREYLKLQQEISRQGDAEAARPRPGDLQAASRNKSEEIQEQLKALGAPTKIYPGQLPLFPDIYSIEVRFNPGLTPPLEPIAWDSDVPYPAGQDQRRVRDLEYRLLGEQDDRATVRVVYQLHAFNKRQQDEARQQQLYALVTLLVAAAAALAFVWVYFFLKRERERELGREHAEKLLLENQLRRQEAGHKSEEMERTLLEQRLATQAAERQTLELKSQLYASIGIMAGSYAHNIKNLLVRPNDLLRRCLEADSLSGDQEQMLHEVRDTLGTVTERLQQILRTVRRDPSRSELSRLDLNQVTADLRRTWEDLAREKWKLTLTMELAPEPLWIAADLSHLQQAVENLLFNARDATFEKRKHLREQAHHADGLNPPGRRQALIDAAGWRGAIVMRTRLDGDQAILEVQDNGIGMTEEVRQRCTETHFSTKRDNAVYEGNTTGMGLGLSFVAVILEHHDARLEIESAPFQGALLRVRFPLARSEQETVSGLAS